MTEEPSFERVRPSRIRELEAGHSILDAGYPMLDAGILGARER